MMEKYSVYDILCNYVIIKKIVQSLDKKIYSKQ